MRKNVHKTSLTFATLALCLFAFTVQAQFTGPGFYRIESNLAGVTNNYIAFTNPYGGVDNDADKAIEMSAIINDESILEVTAVPPNPSGGPNAGPDEYNIFRKTGENYLQNSSSTIRAAGYPDDNKLNLASNKFIIEAIPGETNKYTITYIKGNGEVRYVCHNSTNPELTSAPITSSSNATRSIEWSFTSTATASVDPINPQEATVAYPNPSSDGIFTLNKASEWSVSSITGQFIKKGNGTQIDLKDQPAGIYVLLSDNGKNASKLIIE